MLSFTSFNLAKNIRIPANLAAPSPVFRLATLRTKTLHQAAKFHDYNFRMYFMQKTVDTFNQLAKESDEKIAAFCENEGKQNYLQIKRMATLNAAYAKTPVFLDPIIQNRVDDLASSSSSKQESSSSNNTDDIEKDLPKRRAFSSEGGEHDE